MRLNRHLTVFSFLVALFLCIGFPTDGFGQSVTEIVPKRAPHGARVMIVGNGLDASSLSVHFAVAGGGFGAAPVVGRTATFIEVSVPPSAVTGAVRVSSGNSTIATFEFTLAATPASAKVMTLAASDKAHDVFKEPSGNFVFVPSGATYVADRKHHQVKLVRPDGSVVVTAGTGKAGFVDGPALQAQFADPRAVTIDETRNVLYIADTQNHVIRRMTLDGSFVATFAGSGRPEDRDGSGAQAGFKQPSGLAIDADGNVYVADTGNDKIKKVTPEGHVTTIAGAGRPGFGDGQALTALFKGPAGVAVHASGVVYIADTQNHVIRKLENGAVTTVAGTGHGGFLDGDAALAEFKEPSALAFDESGNLLVADTKNHIIRKVVITSATAMVATLAGSGKPGFADGDPASAQFHEPSGIDAQGALYIADTKNDAIRLLLRSVALTDIYPRSGDPAGGGTIRIFGTGFVPGQTEVRFGANPATSVTYVAPTELLATVPPGAIGAVDVVVTTPAGSATLDDGFLYRQPFGSIFVMPLSPSVDVGAAVPLFAFGVTAENEQIEITEQATWTTAIPTVAVVDANGVARGLSIGTTTVTATYGGLSSSVTLTVIGYTRLDVSPPTVSLSPEGNATLAARATKSNGAVDDITAQAAWASSDPDVATVAAGHVTAIADGSATISASFGGFTSTATVVVSSETIPPDPSLHAPDPDMTVTVPLVDRVRFLYSGPDAIQRDVTAGAITDERVTVIRGTIRVRGGAPLPGARITVLGHSEYGHAVSRADGVYDIAVNGGGPLTLRITKNGYIASDRLLMTQWNQQLVAPDVVLVPYDASVTSITSANPVSQIAQGGTVSDADGTRRATLYIPPQTRASLVMPNGSTSAAAELHVRATEFTVGGDGPRAMPAPLPPSSGYTYCVELSADEAVTTGATEVRFDKPLSLYVENFLAFPVGTAVPLGYYDRVKGAWIGAENGRVVKILAIANGIATIDANGDAQADGDAALAALGIDTTERTALASLYAAGQTLWRVRVTHFTPWDPNWPLAPPAGATAPEDTEAYSIPASAGDDSSGKACGWSTIDCQNQTLSESIPIVGTPFALEYNSGRVAKTPYKLTVRATGASVPSDAKRVELRVTIAGRSFASSYEPAANIEQTFEWDGLDAYGKPWQGAAFATVDVAYVYDAAYTNPASSIISWALPGTTRIAGSRLRAEYTMRRVRTLDLGHFGMSETGFGDWTFSAQAFYDGNSRAIYEGGGRQRGGNPRGIGDLSLYTIAGNGGCCDTGNGGPAREAQLEFPISMAETSDGTLYMVDTYKIKKVDRNGIITTIAGGSSGGFTPDGAPALGSRIRPWDLAIGPDDTVYFNDIGNYRVRRIVNGILETVAGNGQFSGAAPDGVPATSVALNPAGFTVGPDGTLYLAHGDVRTVGRDGILRTLATDTDGTLNADRITVGPEGNVYATSGFRNTIHRIAPDGAVTQLASSLRAPQGITITPDGTLLVAERDRHVVTAIEPEGTIRTFAGNGQRTASPEGSLSQSTPASYPMDVRIAADGSVLLAISGENKFRRTRSVFPPMRKSGTVVPSAGGSVAYVFVDGRHVRTVDTLTGVTLLTLAYDDGGRLITITDADSNVTTIQRDGAGNPTAVVAPGGQRTTLTVTAGKLTHIANPAGEAYDCTYHPTGLLATLTDRRRDVHRFTYDPDGLLIKDEDPVGGFIALVRSGRGPNYTVSRSSAEGRTQSYALGVAENRTATRLHTGTDGLVRNWSRTGATTTVSHPDGTRIVMGKTSDRRFGSAAPLLSSVSATLPSGLSASISATSTAVLADETDPLSLVSMTDETIVNGRRVSSTYVRATNTITLTSAASRTSTIKLDSKGRTSEFRRTTLAPMTYSYTATGKIQSIMAGGRTYSFDYDPQQRLTRITDPLSRSLRFSYDDAGRVLTQTLPNGRVIGFTYDTDGNVASVTPPSRPAHALTWTPIGLLSSYVPPAGATTQYEYDRDRRLRLVTRPDGTALEPGYDGAGRLTSLATQQQTMTWVYGANSGALARAQDGEGGALEYTYDGPLVKSVTWTGDVAGVVSLDYDNNLRVVSEAAGGLPITFAYDADDLLTRAGALTLTPDGGSGLLSGTELGAITDQWTYNEFGEATNYTVRFASTPIATLVYTRDDGGRVLSLTSTLAGVTSVSEYAYDTHGRLTTVINDGSTTDYDYDANGNRTALRHAGNATNGTYDSQDRLISYGATTYDYNANGELVEKNDASGRTAYTYNAFGDLRSVTLPNGRVIEYVVDAQNRRIGRKVDGALTHGWLYAGQLRIVAELDGTGATVSRFVYASRANVPDYMIRSGATYRIISDLLGSPRMVVNVASGVLVQAMEYDEFGNVLADTNPGFQPFGFAGGLYDRETGLMRFGARDYDPQTGRWTTKDPIGFNGGGTNLYEYVSSSPVNMIDPAGLSGKLTIYSSYGGGSSGPALFDSHSWIVFTPDGGAPTSYGTFGFGVEAPRGLNTNWEIEHWSEYGDRSKYDVFSRTTWLNDAQEAALMSRIDAYRRLGDDAWTSDKTCSTFAGDAWRSATGENLEVKSEDDTYANPITLSRAIRKANNGLGSRVLRRQK